jgi:phosphoglucosamine mutase
MSRKYFGTDGIRGTVGHAPITPDFILRLAHAVGRVLKRTESRPMVLIGKDTRISGYMLESALESGFNSAGVDVMLLGPLPTPGVAYLTRSRRLGAGGRGFSGRAPGVGRFGIAGPHATPGRCRRAVH